MLSMLADFRRNDHNHPMKTSPSSILITGVSSGIGRATLDVFHQKGWLVIGTVRREEDAEALRALYPDRLHVMVFDVARPMEDHLALVEDLRNLLDGRGLDVLVQNAGVAQGGPLAWQSESDVREIFETNVLGVFKLTKAAVPLLQERKPGRMVMISSVSGLLVTPFVGAYAGSKFALEAFTDAYRNELGMLGIRVIGIQPGPVATPIWAKARAISDKYLHTPYGDILARQEEFIQQAESRALPVDRVVRTVVQAATADQPRSRYLLVTNPWLVRIAKLLPDRMKDKMIMARLGQAKKW